MQETKEPREDYILAIFRLGQKGKLTSADLSRAMNVSRASVSEMVKKLVNDGMITFDHKEIALTDKGRDHAKKLLSTHRLWEVFLVDELGMALQDAHDIAHRLEHVTTDELMHRLNKYLNYPKACPNGKPIYINTDHSEE